MLPEKRKKVALYFLAIVAVFSVILAYLLFLNIGLEMGERANPQTGMREVYIGNSSSRVIYNITVSYFDAEGNKKQIAAIDSLRPGEQYGIQIPELQGMTSIKIIAEAPFHQALIKTVSPFAARKVEIGLSLRAPEVTFVGSLLALELELCNNGDDVDNVIVGEAHDESFFGAFAEERTLSIKGGECTVQHYELMPKKAGETTIYFNITAYGSTDKLQKKIMVSE